jgi:hypothetical protein
MGRRTVKSVFLPGRRKMYGFGAENENLNKPTFFHPATVRACPNGTKLDIDLKEPSLA